MIIKLILVFLESNSLALIELCADSNYVILQDYFLRILLLHMNLV